MGCLKPFFFKIKTTTHVQMFAEDASKMTISIETYDADDTSLFITVCLIHFWIVIYSQLYNSYNNNNDDDKYKQ